MMHSPALCNSTSPGILTAYSQVSASRKFSFSKDTVGLPAASLKALRPVLLSAAGNHCIFRIRLSPGFLRSADSEEDAKWVEPQVDTGTINRAERTLSMARGLQWLRQ